MNVHIRAISGLAAGLGLSVLGCTGTEVRTDRDPGVNLAKYRTFDVGGQVLVNGVPDRRNTLARDRVEAALEQELQQKGLAPSAQSPDLIAIYTAGSRSVNSDSTLLIDLIDPRTNKLVWRSVVEMNHDLRSAKDVYKAVGKALERYPQLSSAA
jgi:hypothetical protein